MTLRDDNNDIVYVERVSKGGDLTHVHICVNLENVRKHPIADKLYCLSKGLEDLGEAMSHLSKALEVCTMFYEKVESGEMVEVVEEIGQTYHYMDTDSLGGKELSA